jgi:hypothetical protein
LRVEMLPGGVGLQVNGDSGKGFSNLSSPADPLGYSVTNQTLKLGPTTPVSALLEQQAGLAPTQGEWVQDRAGLLGLE